MAALEWPLGKLDGRSDSTHRTTAAPIRQLWAPTLDATDLGTGPGGPSALVPLALPPPPP